MYNKGVDYVPVVEYEQATTNFTYKKQTKIANKYDYKEADNLKHEYF